MKCRLSSDRAETYGQGGFLGRQGWERGEVVAGGETYGQRPRRRGGSWEEDPLFLIAHYSKGQGERAGCLDRGSRAPGTRCMAPPGYSVPVPSVPCAWVVNIADREGGWVSVGGLLLSLSLCPLADPSRPLGAGGSLVSLTLTGNRDIANLQELEQCGHLRLRAGR